MAIYTVVRKSKKSELRMTTWIGMADYTGKKILIISELQALLNITEEMNWHCVWA